MCQGLLHFKYQLRLRLPGQRQGHGLYERVQDQRVQQEQNISWLGHQLRRHSRNHHSRADSCDRYVQQHIPDKNCTSLPTNSLHGGASHGSVGLVSQARRRSGRGRLELHETKATVLRQQELWRTLVRSVHTRISGGMCEYLSVAESAEAALVRSNSTSPSVLSARIQSAWIRPRTGPRALSRTTVALALSIACLASLLY